MPLSFFANTFAGNPLNRASEVRGDESWMAEQLKNPDSLAVALWNGQPLVEDAPDGSPRIAYLQAGMAADMSPGWERLLFLGLWKQTAIFAIDIEGGANPSEGVLE